MRLPRPSPLLAFLLLVGAAAPAARAQLAVIGRTVHTVSGAPIADGVVMVLDGRIVAVGPRAAIAIPEDYRILEAHVVTPGLIDARSVVGLSGYLNQEHDQDQIDLGQPLQPELRALDAYNAREPLVAYLRGYGVTTLHTGHAPGPLVSGQTMVVKTAGDTVAEAVVVEKAMIAATLGRREADGPRGGGDDGKAPGTRAKAVAMLRAELIQAQEYGRKRAAEEADKRPAPDLRKEAFLDVLERRVPLLVTANRHQDILTALRLAREFGFRLVLDGCAEAPEVLDEIAAAGVPVILHATMARAQGERENLSMATAARLAAAGIPFAIESGFESYVPKTRVVLFEAGMAAAHGLAPEQALAAVTLDAARILGLADRIGSIEPGKDADLALFDGDPLEFTSHCVGVVIDGRVVSESRQ